MFYDEKLMVRGGRVHEVWRLGVGGGDTIEDVDHARRPIHDICVDLKHWALSQSNNPRRRLSLHATATLTTGVARAYKRQLRDLSEDTMSLMENMVIIRRSFTKSSSSDEDTMLSSMRLSGRQPISSSPKFPSDIRPQTPEAMRQVVGADMNIWPDVSSIKDSSEGETLNFSKSSHRQMDSLSNSEDDDVFEKNIDPDDDHLSVNLSMDMEKSLVQKSSTSESSDRELVSCAKDTTEEEDLEDPVDECTNITHTIENISRESNSKLYNILTSSSPQHKRNSESGSNNVTYRFSETANAESQTDVPFKRRRVEHGKGKNYTPSCVHSDVESNKRLIDSLPFGCTVVYEDCNKKTPIKIITGLLNPIILDELQSNK